ncbi:MAG: TRAP transporter small permease [Candidatus Tectomicrobia bacterium]|nr:TRAP transporter small permease [Candidatus Tectomicrobia bacterium]
MAFIHRLDRLLAGLERAAVVVLLLSLLLLGLLQIILRNAFAGGLFWADEVLRHLVLWLGFLGASLATHEQRHLRMDVLARWLPAGAQPWLALLINLLAASGCMVLAQAAWTFVRFERESGAVLSVGLAVWIAQSIVPLGFALMALRFALGFLETLAQLRKAPS